MKEKFNKIHIEIINIENDSIIACSGAKVPTLKSSLTSYGDGDGKDVYTD